MDLYDDFDDFVNLPRIKNMPVDWQRGQKKLNSRKRPTYHRAAEIETFLEQRDDAKDYSFSYNASRHERSWIMDSLGTFYEMQWFSDILRSVKGGKEASVYQCSASEDSPVRERYIAAKIYRPRRFRNLKQDYIYREGRDELDNSGNVIINEGKLKAIRQRTEFGRQVMHSSWLEHEYKTMKILQAAGGDVPSPYASSENAILMEFIGDLKTAAPTLNTIDLDLNEAKILFERVVHNIDLLLAHGRVHADLSAYNILYWNGDIKLIDFPQAISPEENRNAFEIFERDLLRVSEYFSLQGVVVEHHSLANKLWRNHGFRDSPEIHPIMLDEDDPRDRKYWDQVNDG